MGATPRGQRRARRVLAAARLSRRAMRFGLYYIGSIDCLGIDDRTRYLDHGPGTPHWTNRFYRMADAADSGRRCAHLLILDACVTVTWAVVELEQQTYELLNYTTGHTYISGSWARRACACPLARPLR